MFFASMLIVRATIIVSFTVVLTQVLYLIFRTSKEVIFCQYLSSEELSLQRVLIRSASDGWRAMFLNINKFHKL